MAVPEFEIPEHFKAHRPNWIKALGRFLCRRSGWRLGSNLPTTPGRYVLPVAPHTSNWDFVFGLYIILAFDLRVQWIGKHTIFIPVVRKLWHALGGMPVDRKNPQGVLAHLEKLMTKQDSVLIAIAPEGTRKKTDHWKTGFLRLAENAEAQIVPIGIDARTKQFIVFDAYLPTGDHEKDLAAIQHQLSECVAIRPENV